MVATHVVSSAHDSGVIAARAVRPRDSIDFILIAPLLIVFRQRLLLFVVIENRYPLSKNKKVSTYKLS